MFEIDSVGADWLKEKVQAMADDIIRLKPTDYNEQTRYLPKSVSSMPGYIRYDVNPFIREIVDCFDIDSPVREINVKKGVQITYTTALESGILYLAAHVKTPAMMYMTADKELARARIENNIIPMFNHSGLDHIIRSNDEHNPRKTGKTADHLQFDGGAYLLPFGAKNADKMRSFSILAMLKDELDAWPETVGKDGDPDGLSDDRCSGAWEFRKIFRGSTPLVKGSSKIEKQYRRGDQREYQVCCKSCGFPQTLRWSAENKENGIIGGFHWETENGVLLPDSVCYRCVNCGEPHYEHDKERLFSPDFGAHWKPTAQPAEPGIRSYHLPALYSPIGMQPWYKCVSDYLRAYDTEERKVIDIGAYQKFYNNILAEPFEIMGSKVRFTSVSAHRRPEYRMGQVPNNYAVEHCGSPILFLTCAADIQKRDIAVAVFGWTRDARCYLISYERFEVENEEDDAGNTDNPVWQRLRNLIEEKKFVADDGTEYRVALTLIDSGYANDTVCNFCMEYTSGVVPILGRDRPGKNQRIREFTEFTTQLGTKGFLLVVDHYKDRMSSVLRRDWAPETGRQTPYHFNAPLDTTDKQLKELTVESRRKKQDEKGTISYEWHRPKGARNELWDLLGYAYASVDIMAWSICIKQFELPNVDWNNFWDYVESDAGANILCRFAGPPA